MSGSPPKPPQPHLVDVESDAHPNPPAAAAAAAASAAPQQPIVLSGSGNLSGSISGDLSGVLSKSTSSGFSSSSGNPMVPREDKIKTTWDAMVDEMELRGVDVIGAANQDNHRLLYSLDDLWSRLMACCLCKRTLLDDGALTTFAIKDLKLTFTPIEEKTKIKISSSRDKGCAACCSSFANKIAKKGKKLVAKIGECDSMTIPNSVGKFIEFLFMPEFLSILMFLLLIWGFLPSAIEVWVTLSLGIIISQILKKKYWRFRPFSTVVKTNKIGEGLYQRGMFAPMVEKIKTSSFPSRAVTLSAPFAYIVLTFLGNSDDYFVIWGYSLLAIIVALLQRTFVQVHFLTDCLFGAALSIFITLAGHATLTLNAVQNYEGIFSDLLKIEMLSKDVYYILFYGLVAMLPVSAIIVWLVIRPKLQSYSRRSDSSLQFYITEFSDKFEVIAPQMYICLTFYIIFGAKAFSTIAKSLGKKNPDNFDAPSISFFQMPHLYSPLMINGEYRHSWELLYLSVGILAVLLVTQRVGQKFLLKEMNKAMLAAAKGDIKDKKKRDEEADPVSPSSPLPPGDDPQPSLRPASALAGKTALESSPSGDRVSLLSGQDHEEILIKRATADANIAKRKWMASRMFYYVVQYVLLSCVLYRFLYHQIDVISKFPASN